MDKKNQKAKKQTIKKLFGVAAKNSANKTVPVIINYIRAHPIYKKRYIKSNKILAHTDEDIVKGQKVTITPTRPLSKKKAWKVIEVGK